jgi:hypothetical protein
MQPTYREAGENQSLTRARAFDMQAKKSAKKKENPE